MTYHEIQDALHEDKDGWTLGAEGEELLRWLLKNYTVTKEPSLPLKKEEKYDYYKDRWLW
jgi:hypothetical protein